MGKEWAGATKHFPALVRILVGKIIRRRGWYYLGFGGERNWRVTADSQTLSEGLPRDHPFFPVLMDWGEIGIRDLAP